MYGVHAVVGKGHGVCPLVGGCPLVGVSIIGGSTVYILREYMDVHYIKKFLLSVFFLMRLQCMPMPIII